MKNMYDENGFLKPGYVLTDAQEREQFLTDWGKGIYYKGADGREYATMDEVKAANKLYYDKMKIDTSIRDLMIKYIGTDGREHQTSEDLERANKAYFDYLNKIFNMNSKNMDRAIFQAQQERILAYIHERYGNYFENLLEQYGYGSKSSEKGPRK